jgi:hypothetical protein
MVEFTSRHREAPGSAQPMPDLWAVPDSTAPLDRADVKSALANPCEEM